MKTLLEKLTKEEKIIALDVVKLFEANPGVRFYSAEISRHLKTRDHKFLNSRRIRKIINYIRCNIMATGVIIATDGYKMSFNAKEISTYTLSLLDRINSIRYMREMTVEASQQLN
jgi:hypothetical protein